MPSLYLFDRVYRLVQAEQALEDFSKPKPSLATGPSWSVKEGRAPAQVQATTQPQLQVKAQADAGLPLSSPYAQFANLIEEVSLPPAFDSFVKDLALRVLARATGSKSLKGQRE
jgi:hypothetical protein